MTDVKNNVIHYVIIAHCDIVFIRFLVKQGVYWFNFACVFLLVSGKVALNLLMGSVFNRNFYFD